jgi:hypothetical protein
MTSDANWFAHGSRTGAPSRRAAPISARVRDGADGEQQATGQAHTNVEKSLEVLICGHIRRGEPVRMAGAARRELFQRITEVLAN